MNDKITGGEAVYRVLRDQGVGTVFGLLGGSMLELYDAILSGGEIAYVGARDERAAGPYGPTPMRASPAGPVLYWVRRPGQASSIWPQWWQRRIWPIPRWSQ